MSKEKHVFIIGSKGIPASYGGFETFVQELVKRRVSEEICYHVACSKPPDGSELSPGETFRVFGAECFYIPMKPVGAAKAVLYDLDALSWTLRYIRSRRLKGCIVYILACRIGPFLRRYAVQLKKEGAFLFLNPDGHEWKRAKWNRMIRMYWKFSEGRMIQQADQIICDSKSIARYIRRSYPKVRGQIRYLSYGSEVAAEELSAETAQRTQTWLNGKGLERGQYYLIVGRFVPENNYETILREFVRSGTEKKLAIISNVEENKFYRELAAKTGFENDRRVVIAGTVYDTQLLLGIRKYAFAYIHGHEVGGTNPSLLEALGSTQVSLLYDVSFNREVAEEAGLYWNREEGSLCRQMALCEALSLQRRDELGRMAKDRIRTAFSWDMIVHKYEKLFLSV